MALDMTTALTIRAKVDGLGEIQKLDRALEGTKKEASGLAGALGKLKGAGTGMGGLLGALVPAAGIAGLTNMAKGAIDAADNLNDLSQKTGVAVPTLSRFAGAAEASGTTIDEVGKAMGRLSKGLVDPQSKINDALKSIGISSTDASGKIRDVDQVMLDLADKFSKMPDGAEKTALAMEIFGKAGANMIPMLNEGKDALGQYSATIDTEMAQAADKFNDALNNISIALAGPFNEAVTNLLPLLTQVAEGIAGFAEYFGSLPEPVQLLAAGFGAVAGAIILLAPAIGGIITIFTTLAPLIGGAIALLSGPVGIVIAIGAVIAVAWQFRDQIGKAFQGAIDAVGGFFQQIGQLPGTLYGIFVQPVIDGIGQLVNWFKDGFIGVFDFIKQPFMQAMEWLNENFVQPVIQFGQQVVDWYTSTWVGIFEYLKQPFMQAWEWIQQSFVAPLKDAFTQSIQFIKDAWAGMQQIISAPFTAALGVVKGALNSIMGAIEGGINGAVGAINALIAAANRVPGVSIPKVSPVKLPRFAEGGVVSGPTIAMVGEGGEPEYIVPQSKASGFAANWMAGKRGASAIPRFAEGGVVVPSSANVSIQTGPVMQMNGSNYVTTQDLSRAVQAGVNQTLSLIAGDGSVRRQLGMA